MVETPWRYYEQKLIIAPTHVLFYLSISHLIWLPWPIFKEGFPLYFGILHQLWSFAVWQRGMKQCLRSRSSVQATQAFPLELKQLTMSL